MKVKQLNKIYTSTMKIRQPWEKDYSRLAEQFFSRRLKYIDQGYDDKDGNLRVDLLDSTGVKSQRVLSSGIHGGLTSPARPWFELGLEDPDLVKFKPAKEWLGQTQRIMRDLFRGSNFYNVIYSVYSDLGVFGTNYMFEHYKPGKGLFFNSLPVGSYALMNDYDNLINGVCRVMRLTADNIVAQFGKENCSEKVRNAAKKNLTKLFKVRHMLIPNKDYKKESELSTKLMYSSCYWEEDATNKFLRKSGYDEFPGFGSRWYVEGSSIYGGSPAQDVLGTALGLQSIKATQMKQEHKKADPPMIVPEDLDYYDNLPGGITPLNSTDGQKQVYPAEGRPPDTSALPMLIQDLRTEIREGMYNDLFVMLMSAPYNAKMTATEVAQRHEEKLIQLGPVLESLHSELFNPMIDRTFNIMANYDLLPPIPEDLRDKKIKVEFVSILAQAQKMVDTNKVDQFMGFLGRNAGIMPELMDIPNPDAVGDGYAEFLSVPENMLRPQDERDSIRMSRAQAQQAQQNAAMGGDAASISKTLSETKTGDTTALDALMGQQ